MLVPKSRQETRVQFLGEQDGVPERLFKDQLRKEFDFDDDVRKLYLVQVRYSASLPQVVLAVIARDGSAQQIVSKVQKAFRSLFHSSQYLDVIFLSSEQERDISLVCRAFFER